LYSPRRPPSPSPRCTHPSPCRAPRPPRPPTLCHPLVLRIIVARLVLLVLQLRVLLLRETVFDNSSSSDADPESSPGRESGPALHMQLVMGKSPVLFGKRTSSVASCHATCETTRKEQEKSHGHGHHLWQETGRVATRSVREGKGMRRGRRARPRTQNAPWPKREGRSTIV
jgi:hypothetical protein